MPYNYNKLRGKIREVYGTESAFADALGDMMTRPTLSLKLNGRSEWSQQEISKTLELLKVPVSKAGEYFFST